MNLSKGFSSLVARVKNAINPEPQLPEWMQPNARTPRWADDTKRFRENQGGAGEQTGTSVPSSAGTAPTKLGAVSLKDRIAPEGYQDKDGFHLGKVPAHKAHAPDIE